MFELREWQHRAHDRCKALDRSIVEACQGSGKTAFSGALAKYWLDTSAVSHVIAVVPSISIKRGVMRTWNNIFGLSVRTRLVRKDREAFRIPFGFDATVITYKELENDQCQDALKLWTSGGNWKFGVVFDEIHHAATHKPWGSKVRTIGHDLATKICIMTGTPFRSDSQSIELMEYIVRDGKHVANPDFTYIYRQAIEDDICRPVACRWIGSETGNVTIFDKKKDCVYVKPIEKIQPSEMSAAKNAVFNPRGEFMHNLITQLHEDLLRLRSNQEYSDAAALFVCRPHEEHGERHVHSIAGLIRRITGIEPVVVWNDDKTSADKIDAFAISKAPYLVAINMVSEGVDIPRLRMIGFCRYTDSEMLFRQIAGRIMRKTRDCDPVASTLYLPAFPIMKAFAQRLWDQADAGLKVRPPRRPLPDEPPLPGDPRFIGIDAEGYADAGRFDTDEVEQPWIFRAEQVTKSNVAHRHFNTVQLGSILKTASTLAPSNQANNVQQNISVQCDRLVRLVHRLGEIRYGNNYPAAWNWFYLKYNVSDMMTVRVLWTYDKVVAAAKDVLKEIQSFHGNGGL